MSFNSKHFSGNISNPDERWTRAKGTKNEVTVRKAAVRVAKGQPFGPGIGNRPGTFQGATNYRGSERPL